MLEVPRHEIKVPPFVARKLELVYQREKTLCLVRVSLGEVESHQPRCKPGY